MELDSSSPPPSPAPRKPAVRKRSNAYDLVIFHTQEEDDLAWANYLKSELQQKRETDSRITLVSELNYLPGPHDEIRRTVSSSLAALVVVTPALLTSFEQNEDFTFDFIDAENMAAVLFYCGVDHQTRTLAKRFPHHERWHKLEAKCNDEELLKMFDALMKLIDDQNNDTLADPLGRSPPATLPNGNKIRRPRCRRVRTNRKNTWIYPERGRCDQETRTCVVFEEDLPKRCNLQVELRGQSSHTNKRLDTTRINGSTFEFTIPEGVCEELKLGFTRDGTCIAVGSFHYESPLDDIDPTMQLMLSCMDAICQDMDAASLDRKLHKIFATNSNSHIPIRAFEQLFSLYELSTKAECTLYPLPSLLHFAAKYGLREVAATLVSLPGAKEVNCLQNANGHTPCDLARIHGHSELYNFLDEYFDTVEAEDTLYATLQNYIQRDLLDQTVQPPALNPHEEENESYFDMSQQNSRHPSSEEDTYQPMDRTRVSQPTFPPLDLNRQVPLAAPETSSPTSPDSYMRMDTYDINIDEDEDRIPSLQLPSPLPSPRVFDHGHRERLKSLQKADHVASTDTIDSSSAEASLMENPFPALIGPDEAPPPGDNSDSQNELVEIMRGLKEGSYTINEAEFMVEEWKRRNRNKRDNFRTFTEKQASIKKQKETLNEVEQEFKTSHGLFSKFKNMVRRPRKSASSPSAPTKSKTAPELDPARLQAATAQLDQAGDMLENPVCDSLPELPASFQSTSTLDAESNRFSTISNSSSSSAASGVSHGSQRDSGIDIAIKRDESPLRRVQGHRKYSNPVSVYDIPVTPPVQLPVLPKSPKSTSDEGSGYEDMENWLNPNQNSVKDRTKSDSSQAASLSPPAEPDPEAPPLPPRMRRTSSNNVVDFLAKAQTKSKLQAPKAPNLGRKSGLPQFKNPAIPPKPKTKIVYLSSENLRKEGGACGGGVTVNRSTSKVSQVPRPTTKQNYSNVVIDLKSALNQRARGEELPSRPAHSSEGDDAPPKLPPRKGGSKTEE